MHVVVVGAGVIGVTTAYYLAELGFEVTVVDRKAQVADGASFGNAGQLSYSFTDALASPTFVARIPGIMIGRDPAYRVRLAPELIPWGLKFLTQCTNRRAMRNTLYVLKLAMRSEHLLNELRKRVSFDFSHRDAGKLVLLSSEPAVQNARTCASLKQTVGCETKVLSRAAAIDLEPALAGMAVDFAGAVYSKNDCVADSFLFTNGMQDLLEQSGSVKFRLGVNAKRLLREGQRIKSVELDDGELPADAVVVCTGAWSGQLLKSVGINPSIYPVRGYSVTLPPGEASPDMSITVMQKKTVFSHINGKLRISGFADFRGFSRHRDSERTSELLAVARDIAPLAADYTAHEQQHWGGYRPMTPNGRPHVGPSNIDGLFLNTGHGMLGWTLACASSHDIAHSVAWSLR